MEFTYSSGDGLSSATFSKSSTKYRLLKAYTGTANLSVNHQTTRGPYQDGVTRLDTNATERYVSLDIMIIGANLAEIQANVQSLVRTLNPLAGQGFLFFTQEDGTSYYLKCVPSDSPLLSPSERGLTFQRATLSFVAHDPFWYTSGTATSLSLSIAGHPFFPFYGVSQSVARPTKHLMGSASPQGEATNAGNFPTGFTCIIYGEIVDPLITNVTTSEYMSFDGTVAAGDRIIFTTGYGNQTCRYYTTASDTTGANAFSYINIGSEFFLLNAGSNVLRLTYTSASAPAAAVISWENRYTGV